MGDPWMLIAAGFFGVATGALSGLLGVGGGIFMVPFLVLIGGLGQKSAQATSLMVVFPMALVATASLSRAGVGDLRSGLRLGLVGVAGSVAGTALALALPGSALRAIFATLMCVVGVKLLLDARRGEAR